MKREEWDKLSSLLILEMNNLWISITGIPRLLKVMHHSMVFTSSISLLRAKDRWCLNPRFKAKVSRLNKMVARGSTPTLLRLQKDQWATRVITDIMKSRDHLKLICFKFIKEGSLLKIRLCNRTANNKEHLFQISGIVSRIWIQIVTSTRFHHKSLLLTRTKVFKGHQLKRKNHLWDPVWL